MPAPKLEDRKYVFVPQDEDNKVVKCFIVENGTRASNPLGIISLTSVGKYQVKSRITGEDTVLLSDATLVACKTLIVDTAKVEGILAETAEEFSA